jgi:RHS repeat-associated protein
VVRTVGGTTTKPAYDGWNMVQERASNNSVSANYLTGLELDQPFIRTAGSSTSYYLSDALGSIVGVGSTTGTVPTTYTYEPYGKTTVSGTSSASFLGFTGRENDSTGTLSLYNYRARAYSPTMNRFLREDPLGFSGGMNLYGYTGSSPTNWSDPYGLAQCGLLDPACWSDDTRVFFETLAFGLAISSGIFLAMTGGWAFFGFALAPQVAAFAATFTGVVSSSVALVAAQTPVQRSLALAALATTSFIPTASFAAIIFSSLWIAIAVEKYMVDTATS